MKECKECREEKKEKYFWRCKGTRDGLRSECIECLKKKNKEYSQKNSEKLRESQKSYYRKNKERVLKYGRDYRTNHPERVRSTQKKIYYSRTPEDWKRVKENAARFKKTEKAKEWNRKYRALKKYEAKARWILNNAVRDKLIVRPERCQICNREEKVEGHHSDYDNPLQVVWVCQECHRNIHKPLKEK